MYTVHLIVSQSFVSDKSYLFIFLKILNYLNSFVHSLFPKDLSIIFFSFVFFVSKFKFLFLFAQMVFCCFFFGS